MAATPSQTGKRALRFAALGLLLLSLPGCQSITVNAGNVAQLRIVDASYDSPGLDIYQNGSALAYNLGFGTASSYVPLNPGSYTLASERAGTRQVLVSTTTTLSASHQYTMIVGNVAANLQETVLQDQTQPAPTSQVSVRVLNWSTRYTPVDVYLVPSNGQLSTTRPLATGVNFTGNSGYINIPQGTYGIAVVNAGTVPTSASTTLLSGSQQNYSSGTVRTVVLLDQQLVTVPGVQAIVLDDYVSPTTMP